MLLWKRFRTLKEGCSWLVTVSGTNPVVFESAQLRKTNFVSISDQYFVSNTCDELWVVHEGKATRFRGDFDEYKKHTSELTQKRVEESVKRIAAVNN